VGRKYGESNSGHRQAAKATERLMRCKGWGSDGGIWFLTADQRRSSVSFHIYGRPTARRSGFPRHTVLRPTHPWRGGDFKKRGASCRRTNDTIVTGRPAKSYRKNLHSDSQIGGSERPQMASTIYGRRLPRMNQANEIMERSTTNARSRTRTQKGALMKSAPNHTYPLETNAKEAAAHNRHIKAE
jgi:hypothetical protein